MSLGKQVIGFVGVGTMGALMVRNLLAAGHPVLINDVNEAAVAALVEVGAEYVPTPKDIASRTMVMFSCLPSTKVIHHVAMGENGLIEGVRPGAAYFEMSTNTVESAKELHQAFLAKGASMLDAPISGGAKGCARGRMAIWVGGDRAIYQQCLPILRVIGDRPEFIGGIGSGLITKLLHNGTSSILTAALGEIMSIGVKAGADPLALWSALRQGVLGRRRTFDGLGDQVMPRDFESSQSALWIAHKDVGIANKLAEEVGVPHRFLSSALQELDQAMDRGWGMKDSRAITLLSQERAGIEIGVSIADVAKVFANDPPAPSDAKHGG